MSGSAERLVALRILLRVEEGAFASRLLGVSIGRGARARVLAVLRWRRLLDELISATSRRPLARLDAEVVAVLRIALVEALELGVPAPVATDAAVRLVRRVGKGSASGLVNAVVRRALARRREILDSASPALRLAHPDWLAERWMERFGEAFAERMMEADQRPAATWVWFTDPSAGAEAAAAGVELVAHPWCPEAFTASPPGPLLELVGAGRAYAQDPSSQLVAHLALALRAEGTAIDLCAAPGGKTALLASGGCWRRLVACDVRLGRARLVDRLLGRAPGAALVVAADGASPPLASGAAELVLVDAPCSGSGTLRRHPELKWRLRPEGVAGAAETQARILEAAAGLVAPGGVLVWATCSLEAEENEALLAAAVPGLEPLDLAGLAPAGCEVWPTDLGGLRLPVTELGDGFTIHALGRS